MADLSSAMQHLLKAKRISAPTQSYAKDNPAEWTKVEAYLRGGPRPTGVVTEMGLGLVEVEDVRRGVTPPPPPTGKIPTGSHGPQPGDYADLQGIPYEFVVTTVYPGDTSTARARLDALKANGMKAVIGLYPEPYSWDGSKYVISAAGVTSLDYFESRQDDILALFTFNEPYWTMGQSAAMLRDLRQRIKAVWPGARVYHDIGWPSGWVPGSPDGFAGGSTKWADQSGVADYVGVWHYPFETSGYKKTEGLARLKKECDFVRDHIKGIPIFLGQSHSVAQFGMKWPSDSELDDWNKSIREALKPYPGAMISWYTWRQGFGTYDDYLVNHPSQWKLTV